MFRFLRALLFGRVEKREIKPRQKQMAKSKEAKKEKKEEVSKELYDELNSGPWAKYPK